MSLNDIQASSVNYRQQVKHPKPDLRSDTKYQTKIHEQKNQTIDQHDDFIIKKAIAPKEIDSKYHNKEIANAAKGIIKKQNINHEI
eukprot:gene10756-3375_t